MQRSKKVDYSEKFNSFSKNNLFENLDSRQKEFIKNIALQYRFTFQEFRQVVEAACDLDMWQETNLPTWWTQKASKNNLTGKYSKKVLLREMKEHLHKLRSSPTVYPEKGLPKPEQRESKKIVVKKSDKEIYGMCPVASPKTVCCNLLTIDAVENCAFGCSYCTIQTFYTDEAIFDADLANKLKTIKINPNRFYHFGSGQASDSLAWGNRFGNLDALCNFAADNPNILVEFKTKSNHISYFLNNVVPANIVCSYSLNTTTIVENEEHFTASLEDRLDAAIQLTEKGIKVAFHFHPMVYYQRWETDYPEIAHRLIDNFKTEDVLFLSFGSVTLIKPVMQKIRQLGNPTKTLQMEFVQDPHGKFTYPDEIKIKMFKKMYAAFQPWYNKVLIYLCMEKSDIWKKSFGYVYENNEKFEQDFGRKTMAKIYK